jgi:hypothetical protein
MKTKIFKVTIKTNSKSDLGIEVMETYLRQSVVAFSILRKAYSAKIEEVIDARKTERKKRIH